MLNRYLLGQAIGIPALVVGQQFFAFLSLENQSKRTMAASIACFVSNALFDHLFVVVLRMGTFGLGLATSLSSWVFFGVQVWYYISGRSEWKFSFRVCRWGDALQIVKLGYSGCLSRFTEMFRCFIVNFLVLKYVGSVGLSAFAASNSLLAIVWSYPFGVMAVSRMLHSISYGEEDRQSMADILRIVLTWCMPVMLAIVAVLVLCAEPLTRLFYQAVMEGVGGVVACSLVLIPRMGMNGLYISNILNGVICTSVVLVGVCLTLKRFPRNLEDLLALPDSFGVGPDERLDIRVSHSGDDIILRLRDNCVAFNPAEHARVMEPEDGVKDFGIRLAYALARDFQYQNLLGLNVLTMRI